MLTLLRKQKKKAEAHMEEDMRELFSSEYEDEPHDDECAYSVQSIEVFDESHEHWNWYNDPVQNQFYPEIL